MRLPDCWATTVTSDCRASPLTPCRRPHRPVRLEWKAARDDCHGFEIKGISRGNDAPVLSRRASITADWARPRARFEHAVRGAPSQRESLARLGTSNFGTQQRAGRRRCRRGGGTRAGADTLGHLVSRSVGWPTVGVVAADACRAEPDAGATQAWDGVVLGGELVSESRAAAGGGAAQQVDSTWTTLARGCQVPWAGAAPQRRDPAEASRCGEDWPPGAGSRSFERGLCMEAPSRPRSQLRQPAARVARAQSSTCSTAFTLYAPRRTVRSWKTGLRASCRAMAAPP